MNEEYLTTKEAATRLQLSEQSIRDFCQRGLLNGATQEYTNGPWRIPIASVEEWENRASSKLHGENEQPRSPTWWQKFRYNPWVFYPALIISGFLALSAFVFAAVSAGADLGPATQQFYEWGIIRPYPSARENEALIVIMKFHRPEGIPDTEPHEKIRRAIEQQASKLEMSHIRVEVDPRSLNQDERGRAEKIAKDAGAKMIIWGEDTGIEFSVNFASPTGLKTVLREAQIVETGEFGRTLYVQPEEYAHLITKELPSVSSFLSFFVIGHTSLESERYNDAIIALESVVNSTDRLTTPEKISQILDFAYSDLGTAKIMMKEYESAIGIFSELIQLNPQNITAFINRGIAHFQLGQLEDAIADLNRAEEINPQEASIYLNRGTFYLEYGRYDDAFSDYDRAVELDPQSSTVYSQRGNGYFTLGEYQEAIAAYDHAIELNPQNVSAYVARGHTYEELDDYVKALTDYSKAIKLDPKYVPAFYNRGNVYAELGQHKDAIDAYSKAIELDPQHSLVFFNRGNSYTKLKQYDKAIADYTRDIELNPDKPKGYAVRGNVFAQLGKHEDAISDVSLAIGLEPHNAAFFYLRGASYEEIDRYEEAIDDYSKAIELIGSDNSIFEEYLRVRISELKVKINSN